MRTIASAALMAVAVLSAGTVAANATCEGRKTTGTVLGAAGGGLIGGAITHGSAVGVLGGAALGGFGGHRIAGNGCRRVVAHWHLHYYTDRNGHRHYYHTVSR